MLLMMLGKKANTENGIANANAKPNIPTAGARIFPLSATLTNSVPIIGPVHEKETITSVLAISKMPKMPDTFSALASIAVLHEAGNIISNPPKKEHANKTNKRKRNTLKAAFVLNVGKEVTFGIRPEDLQYQAAPAAENNMQVKVTNKEPLGAETHVFVQVRDANIVAKVSPEVVVQLGDTINFTPDMTRAKFFDLDTEINICEPEIEKKW